MTKIKFKFHQKPLSDEQISSFKNFDSLMTAFVATPKPSLQYRLIHNRFFIYTTGIMSGIILTTIATLFILKTETTQLSQTQNTITSPLTTEAIVSNSSTENSASNSNTELKNSGTEKITETENSSVEKKPEEKSGGVKKSFQEISRKENESDFKKSSPKENLIVKQTEEKPASTNKTVTEKSESNVVVQFNQSIPQPTVTESLILDDHPAVLFTSDSSVTNYVWKPSEEFSLKILTENPDSQIYQSPNNQLAESSNQLDDSSKKKLTDVTAQVANSVVELSKGITEESKDSYQWMRAKLNGVFASKYHDKRQTTHDTVSIQNRAAQVSFLYPIGSNGIISGKYSNVFSFNILSGYNGGVNGFELGGLVNIDRKNMNGLQIGGLTNVVFGNVNGLQLGGLVNHARNVTGAQISGLVNTSLGSVDGTQIGGIINYVLDSINGAQIGGIANISTTSHNVNGTQIGGIANLSLGKMNGSQISGIINVANKINGFQIGLINVGVKVAGMQIGLINISDSLKGVPIGLISISRNGLFHVDVFNSDFSNINASVRLGSNAFYNIFSIGVSPNTTDGNRYSFGYGIGTHINISKKFFTNIDALAWNVHYNNFNDWSTGINMINQLRILPGFQITKGIGLYAGPCLNVEVLHDSYNSAVKSHLYNGHGGGTTGVNGWIGWTAGLQFF